MRFQFIKANCRRKSRKHQILKTSRNKVAA
jgi:hypothetical protein